MAGALNHVTFYYKVYIPQDLLSCDVQVLLSLTLHMLKVC